MAIPAFLAEIEANLKTDQATEHTHRPALKKLFETLPAPAKAINEPKKTAYGAPDFLIQQGNVPVGRIEAKDVGANLEHFITDSERDKPRTSEGEQLKRYRANLSNLLYTDGLEWHWFVNGERRTEQPVRLATWQKAKKKLIPKFGAEQDLKTLLQQFAAQQVPTVDTPRDLAQRLAQTARWLCDVIRAVFKDEGEKGTLHTQLDAFRQTLLPSLQPDDFADMYAQTIVYGLFAARVAAPDKPSFSRLDAAQSVPKTNPFLRKLFQEVAGYDLDERIAWLVDDCADLLARTDMGAVLQDFGKATMQEDPVVHFYETFLAAYDPAMREARGVYYTPEPVVSYIVRSVDALLRERFGKIAGPADEQTVILDPATGTATFLYAVVQRIYETLEAQGMAGYWNSYVPDKLLPRMFGFELLMAPYTIAHLKLGWLLDQQGYQFGRDERLGVYLTNALESMPAGQQYMPFAQFIVDEGMLADQVKQQQPVMVVLGNPPYSGHSENKGDWISGLVRDYYQVDGKPLGERNPKWLQDDYVKFLRFGQWRIHQTGEGVLAFISNNGYLDNPTFRGMRQSLLHEFNTIYLLNLHGNSKKKERAPDGSPDENVFDIMQGVTIGIFVKQHGPSPGPATVYYTDLWGEREGKYASLIALDVSNTEWQTIVPSSPWYLFVPQDTDLGAEYDQGWRVTEISPQSLLGFQTHRDGTAIAYNTSNLHKQICDYLGQEPDSDRWLEFHRRVDYRPLDTRVAYLGNEVTDRPRLNVVRHLFSDNIALNLVRQTKADEWHHALMSDKPTPAVFLEIKDGSSIFPLYLYPTEQEIASGLYAEGDRRPNLSDIFTQDVAGRLGLTFVPDGAGDLAQTVGPEDIFHYIYAVFHSPTYRERYAEFLKIDFPRVPLTSNRALFAALAAKGAALVDLHLLCDYRGPGASAGRAGQPSCRTPKNKAS